MCVLLGNGKLARLDRKLRSSYTTKPNVFPAL